MKINQWTPVEGPELPPAGVTLLLYRDGETFTGHYDPEQSCFWYAEVQLQAFPEWWMCFESPPGLEQTKLRNDSIHYYQELQECRAIVLGWHKRDRKQENTDDRRPKAHE